MRFVTLALLVLSTLACREPLDRPDYPDPSDNPNDIDDGGLPGDAPWDGESPRLSFGGLFYEGDATDEIIIDNATINYYIYEGSYFQQASDDHVEGFQADVLTLQNQGVGFWGGGVHFTGIAPQDFSQWTTLHVALKSSDPEMDAFELGLVGQDGDGIDVEGRALAADHGFTADGEWHVVNIPLAAMSPAVPLDRVTVGLLLISVATKNDAQILIDDLYFTTDQE